MSTTLLPRIYEKREFRAAWSDPTRAQLLDVVRGMDADGLRPGDYHLAELEQLQARLAKIRLDPRYAEKNNMSWLGGQLVQRPAPNDALDRVKIMFPNPYLVYLHDTPNQWLFGKGR